jgi:hypothetical protein
MIPSAALKWHPVKMPCKDAFHDKVDLLKGYTINSKVSFKYRYDPVVTPH